MFLNSKPFITKEEPASGATRKKWGFSKRCPFKFYTDKEDYITRILVKYEDPNACWHIKSWSGKDLLKTYPIGTWKGDQFAFRAEYYKRLVGPIPKGKRVANSCGNAGCLKPEHMLLQDYGCKHATPADKLLSILEPKGENECWPLKNNTLNRGAVINIKDSKTRPGGQYTTYRASVIAYKHFIGEIPDGYFVKTSCGKLGCLNPKHFILSANQYATTKPKRIGARIDADEVREIRALFKAGKNYMELANQFKVPYMVIYSACNYLSWKNIE